MTFRKTKEPGSIPLPNWELVLPAMAGLVATLEFDTDRMAELAPAGFTLATDIAEWLVRRVCRSGWHTRRRALRSRRGGSGVGLDELDDDELASIGADLTPEVREVLRVTGSVSSRDARGGTAPVQVAKQLDAVRETAAQLRIRLRR